ncbi:nucleotidyl transferase AbiEii/AbiGii toxin family protein [Undibacterium sp. Rencai35W]|uniref:nucleotidyl transferase AbiEii/AbiGii toxin family protein n=1 Tax=Undibacterium sp. Rencai35W TaxID=3413046 RepID=UPI003BF151AE
MAESWFALSRQDQAEALEVAADRTGRPAHLLEKDIWVVWALAAIYGSTLAGKLTFKGGTSLSKVYKIIDRFSEDVDLTYDIRELVPDMLREGNPIPVSPSQEKKITSEVRKRLPAWIESAVMPVIKTALFESKIEASLAIVGQENEKLIVSYPALKTGTGYAPASIQLEFGARATGEPNHVHDVGCDIASVIDGVDFPAARPLVMAAERTFWEKATAAHVYCLQGRLRGERYSRHWYDLAAISRSAHYESAVTDRELGKKVAEHKSMFFAEKDAAGAKVDYQRAVTGAIQLIPTGESLAALERDYSAMLEDGLLALHQPDFSDLIENCRAIEMRINRG